MGFLKDIKSGLTEGNLTRGEVQRAATNEEREVRACEDRIRRHGATEAINANLERHRASLENLNGALRDTK